VNTRTVTAADYELALEVMVSAEEMLRSSYEADYLNGWLRLFEAMDDYTRVKPLGYYGSDLDVMERSEHECQALDNVIKYATEFVLEMTDVMPRADLLRDLTTLPNLHAAVIGFYAAHGVEPPVMSTGDNETGEMDD